MTMNRVSLNGVWYKKKLTNKCSYTLWKISFLARIVWLKPFQLWFFLPSSTAPRSLILTGIPESCSTIHRLWVIAGWDDRVEEQFAGTLFYRRSTVPTVVILLTEGLVRELTSVCTTSSVKQRLIYWLGSWKKKEKMYLTLCWINAIEYY